MVHYVSGCSGGDKMQRCTQTGRGAIADIMHLRDVAIADFEVLRDMLQWQPILGLNCYNWLCGNDID